MTEHLTEDDVVPIQCRHCSAVSIVITIKEGNAVKRCTSCKGDTVIRVQQRTGRWEINTGPLPRKDSP